MIPALPQKYTGRRFHHCEISSHMLFLYKLYQHHADCVLGGQETKTRLTKSACRSILGGKDGSTQTLGFPVNAVLTTELMRTARQILTLGLNNRGYKQTGETQTVYQICFCFKCAEILHKYISINDNKCVSLQQPLLAFQPSTVMLLCWLQAAE